MTTIEDRLDAIEARLDHLRIPPVRDELLSLRDVHGRRLDAIEARLQAIEREVSETTSWIERRFTDVDLKLDVILAEVRANVGPGGEP